ncbi:16S rRNA (guanine(966)-N(2))-methyltransferase RsmD [Actinomycetaceae bacterium WB03_NA08]|uniref:16S rRNA (Guanine(966)-N(2))-methyltransferase RsmD n=1 Tax=Scrofimicrobium canadense TaxID=2652290 RepID=A0A6N7VRS4_9ACTO|nr:16S rRNA (guanine(966)-N(2))-methyltransferase RsmD [Scrofimicrobium canadense]MSS83660.1 16S rRNA (guanine(966)-N(2))-methyltransferase RsmD [Scrofimicrobium canadense]
MTRVIAGTAKGRVLKVPKTGTRPTSSKMREALFSKLESWGVVQGARVLDLFAGSGALAIEALSRGAASASLVEISRQSARIVKDNLQLCGMNARVSVMDAAKFTSDEVFDLVFLDPPYDWPESQWQLVFDHLLGMVSPDAVIVAERSRRSEVLELPDGLEIEQSRTFGDSALYFIAPVRSET